MSLRLRPGVSTADTEYGTVVLDERNGEYWQLNATGALVVRLLLDGRTLGQAAAAVAEEFDVTAERALDDATALLDRLRAAGLVVS
ncbi:lasso peptide biosynthesis PqqD family chaperone [Actinomadura kijaniata]|uniref:lasso peptide biosynthesis PqqD family chaperone n=1 Tax=Actinomadura kijaniata TaxID=46161 RepID=UPI003F1BAF3A